MATFLLAPPQALGANGSGSFTSNISEATRSQTGPNCYARTTHLAHVSGSGSFDRFYGNLKVSMTGNAPYQNQYGTFDNANCTGSPGAANGVLTVHQLDQGSPNGKEASCALSGNYSINNGTLNAYVTGQCNGKQIDYRPTEENILVTLNYSNMTASGSWEACDIPCSIH